MYLKARWEAKTDNLIVKNIAKNRIEDLRRRQDSDLHSRRSKLANLLAGEDAQYEKEFMENLETPE